MLEDLTIKRLNIQLTKRCNQRCRSCNSYQLAEKEKTEEELSLEEIADLIADACGQWNIHNIALTGGEPTIRKDILEIGKIASAFAPNVSVTTNGFYFSEKEKVMEMVRGGGESFFIFLSWNRKTGSFCKCSRSRGKITECNWMDS